MFQLENQYSLFDYSININEVIQLIVIVSATETDSTKKSELKVPKNLEDEKCIQSCSTATSSITEEVNIL
jgi:E3 ubiquitin-protein ligase UHRF1